MQIIKKAKRTKVCKRLVELSFFSENCGQMPTRGGGHSAQFFKAETYQAFYLNLETVDRVNIVFDEKKHLMSSTTCERFEIKL